MRQTTERLEKLRQLAILDTTPEHVYDELVRLMVKTFDVPIGMVNLLDAGRDWFKGCIGFAGMESPAETSFCQAFFSTDDDTIVARDTTKDERFRTHPFVIGPPFIRFYAAARLSVDGETVGTLCAYDVKPHDVSQVSLDNLRTLANAAVFHLGARIHPAAVLSAPEMRVVLLDDEPASAEALTELLQLLRPDLQTEVHATWADAIASILGTRPFSVIADLKRDPLESLASTRLIRAALGERVPRLIAVSGDVIGIDALRCEDGFDHALVKPMEIDALLSVLPPSD